MRACVRVCVCVCVCVCVINRSCVRRPCGVSRSPSIDVDPPSVGRSPSDVSSGGGGGSVSPGSREYRYDDVLVRCYGYPGDGRQFFPLRTPLFNKYVVG